MDVTTNPNMTSPDAESAKVKKTKIRPATKVADLLMVNVNVSTIFSSIVFRNCRCKGYLVLYTLLQKSIQGGAADLHCGA